MIAMNYDEEAPSLTVHEMREFATPQYALGTIQPGDGVWITLYAMLMSLVEDLADARALGYWQDHPAEMLDKPGQIPNRHTKRGYISTRLLGREFMSHPITELMHTIRAASNGKIVVGRGNLIRLAKAHEIRWKHNANNVGSNRGGSARVQPALNRFGTEWEDTQHKCRQFLCTLPLGKTACVETGRTRDAWVSLAEYYGMKVKLSKCADGRLLITRIK